MYRVEFSNLAAKELEKIHKADRFLYGRLVSAIQSLQINPFQGKKLKGPFRGDYSQRVGNYRVIYTVHKTKLVVYIIDLGHRKEIYKT